MARKKKVFAPELWQYVIDTSSLVNISRLKGIDCLDARKGAMLISEKVAEELTDHPHINKGDKLRQFVLNNPEIKTPFKDNEEDEYLRLLRQPEIDEGEASVMAIAINRRLRLVIDERNTKATGKANNHGIKTLTWSEFLKAS